jgi:hypothetical protein
VPGRAVKRANTVLAVRVVCATMRVFGERQPVLALVVMAMVVLEILASAMFLALYDFDIGVLAADPAAVPARGPEVATLLRWGAVIDMLGYLALAPIVVYLRGRLRTAASEQGRQSWVVDLLTFGGLGWVLIGSTGAALWASAGPPLLEASVAGSKTAEAAGVAFAALADAVNVGLWGTLEWLLLPVWLIGVGWLVRAEGRSFGWLAILAGVGDLAYGLRTGLSGRPPVDLTSPFDFLTFAAFGLFFAWAIWLAIRLWQGR